MAGAREAGHGVVLAACHLLVADLGGEAVARLAALTRLEADIEVPILLPEVLAEARRLTA